MLHRHFKIFTAWLPVRPRIQFKILILVFKAIHGLEPPYISDSITVKPKCSYNLRSNSSLLLEPPKEKMHSTPGLFVLLCHVCGIACRLSCVTFNHCVLLTGNLRLTFFGQARTSFSFLSLFILLTDSYSIGFNCTIILFG